LAWKTNLDNLHDLKAARVWYKMGFSQLKQEHPEVDPSLYPNRTSLSEKSYSLMYLAYKRLIEMPNDATISPIEANLQEAKDQVQATEDQENKIAAEKHVAFQKILPGLLAQRKEVGDTVCNSSNQLIGQVERVDRYKVQIRQHLHRNGYVNSYAGVAMAAQDWDTLDWFDYNEIIKCN
jgi:hypothetical protein